MGQGVTTSWVCEEAKSRGFALCGVARAEKFPELAQYDEWLAQGFAGEMKYLADERRRDPALVIEGARSVIVCALPYNTAYPYSVRAAHDYESEPRGWISRYAWGSDYHEVMWDKLNGLLEAMRARSGAPFEARAYADTGPVSERVFAKHAGLGWIGKNTLLLNDQLGSWFFLGVIFTSLELEASVDAPKGLAPDLCGSCTRCLDACPTGALTEAGVMDARKCISYLTIELRGEIPEEFREKMGWHVYGCDICQDVCPYNRGAGTTNLREFQPRSTGKNESLFVPELYRLAGIREEEYAEAFRGSAMKRAKWKGLVRNACNALGNAKLERGTKTHTEVTELLQSLSKSTESTVAESAQWALSRIEQRLSLQDA